MVIAIAFQLTTFDEYGWAKDPFIILAPSIAWSQAELNWALISATIPTFQNFLKILNTHFGGLSVGESQYGYGTNGSRSRSKGNMEYELSKMRSESKVDAMYESYGQRIGPQTNVQDIWVNTSRPTSAVPTAETGNTTETRMRPPTHGYTASVDSYGSQRLMIRKDVTWNVKPDEVINAVPPR